MNEAEPSPYAEMLKRLGQRHERGHLETFEVFEDLSSVNSPDELSERTKAAIEAALPVVYQGFLRCNVMIGGVDCEVSGRPDFLIRDELGYKIRDSKMSRRITLKDHPEIVLQMQTYAWLFDYVFKTPASKLEVHRGDGTIDPVDYAGPDPVINALREVVRIRQLREEPFAPVGFTKCADCGFHDYCWPRAEANKSVALVINVDKGLATTLHEMDVLTIDQLIDKFDAEALEELKRPKGSRLVRVGSSASDILRNAKVLAAGQELLLGPPAIPAAENYVMFDLEGMPPHLDELQKVYLWGMQIFGENPSEYIYSTAGFGANGDRAGWEEFLVKAGGIFDVYGDIRFVHWASYEKTLIGEYKNRYGDDTGVADRVLASLLDLLAITEQSIVLPLPSYSLKVIEKYVKFRRTLPEANGAWSMAKYIEATETQDEATREQLMDAIRTYNREDLEATWAVLLWLRTKKANSEPTVN
jgi:predicted RecB family nuclease